MFKHMFFWFTILTFIFLGFRSNDNTKFLRNKLKWRMDNKFSNDAIQCDNGKYILNYNLDKDDTFISVIVKQSVDKYKDPMYFNFDTIMLPIGGGSYKEIQTVIYRNSIKLKNIMVNNQTHLLGDYEYQNFYMDHSETTKYLLNEHNIDFKTVPVANNILTIMEMKRPSKLYIYGNLNLDGTITADKISNNFKILSESIIPCDYTYYYSAFAITIMYIINSLV
ncbi:putative ORFan [Tupanvirus deep ocean]|uniref:ORFan n=1 Tax=Tupanvirus soda lake TaxID=2126985 RepID=A0AC59HBU2_9VIRU|nr:putative ORFan [Tupanvirus deep ocean]AUL79377.2 putative ORFan [Tupanvirus deep ocean]